MYAIMFKLDILQIYNIKSYRQKCKDVLDSEQVQYSIDVMTAYCTEEISSLPTK